jgi:exosortase/archaeosortase family protein
VIAVAIPLSVAKNGLRIFVLAMLTTRVDPSFMTGRLHHQGGIVYFLIALAGIGMLIWIARRGEAKPTRALAMATSPDTATR